MSLLFLIQNNTTENIELHCFGYNGTIYQIKLKKNYLEIFKQFFVINLKSILL